MRPQSSPAELEELLLRAALLEGDGALDAWDSAKRLPRHIDDAPYRVLPLLYRNLSALGVDDPEMERLKGVYRHCWSSNQRLLAEARNALDTLRDSGVETLMLGDVANRHLPIERVGVLVRAAAAVEALDVLRQAGWASAADPLALDRLMRVGDAITLDRAGHTLVLRTSPFWEPVPEEPIWEAARAGALHPTHELMRACTGALAVPPAPSHWIPHAVSVLRSDGNDVDWDLLTEHAEQWCMSARLAAALETLASDFAQPVPPEALERLRSARRPLHERAAHSVGRRGPARGAHHVLQWHRHRELLAVRPEAAGRFPGYWRASLGEDTWGAVVGRYARRVRGLG